MGKAFVYGRNLRHVAYKRFAAVENRLAERDFAAVWYRAHNGLDERAFAAAVGAYDADEIVVEYIEIRPIYGRQGFRI